MSKLFNKTFFIFLGVMLAIFLVMISTIRISESIQDSPYDKEGIYYNTFDKSHLTNIGDKFYYEDDNYTSKLGFDISSYQKDIDYKKLKEEGFEFVYIRAGYRGNTLGALNTDEMLNEHYLGAKEANLKIGFYFFTQAINTEEAKEEVEYFLDITKDYEIDLPYALDAEYSGNKNARTKNLKRFERREITNAFIDELNKNNVDSIIYGNSEYIKDNYIQKELANHKLWFAQYSHFPTYNYPFNIWQYTQTGEVNGYDGYLDLDIMFIPKD